MTGPAVIITVVTVVIPLLQSAYYSLTDWNGVTSRFIGLNNYSQLVETPSFSSIVRANAALLVSIPIGMVLAFAVAFLLNQLRSGSRLFRTLIFLPTSLSWVVVGLVAQDLLASNGLINRILRGVGLNAIASQWLGGGDTALLAVVVTFTVGSFGLNTIIFVVGMGTLDQGMIDAARVDGATSGKLLWYVVAPAMRNFSAVVFTITLVGAFTGLFGLIYVMTGGGPDFATTTLEFGIYQSAFQNGSFGLGAALGIGLFLVMLVLLSLIGLYRALGKARA